MKQIRETVKFNGQPVEVALAYPTGKECSNGAFLYTLKNDPRALFATPVLNEQIQILQPRAGERISIQLKSHNQWEVTRVEPPTSGNGDSAPAPLANGFAAGSSQSTQQGNPTTKAALMNQLGDVLVNGIRPAVPIKVAYQDALTQFLIMSIEAAHRAEDYAARNNYSIRFTSEDVQGMASTLFIQAAKQDFLTWNGGAR